MRLLSPRARLCLIALPYLTQLSLALASLLCYYCGSTLMLRDWLSGAEIREVPRTIEKILGHGWMGLNAGSVFLSAVHCVVNLYWAWKYGYVLPLPQNTVCHVFMYINGPTDHAFAKAVRTAYEAVPSSAFFFADLATTMAMSAKLSNFFFGAVCLQRSATSAWWKKVVATFDETVGEENEAMNRAARSAHEGLLQDFKEPTPYLDTTPGEHSIITGSMCVQCKRGSFTEGQRDGSVGEHDGLVGTVEGAQTLDLNVGP